MAGRSKMSPEELMAKTSHLILERYVALVVKIDKTADQRSEMEQLQFLDRVSLTGRRVNAFYAQGRKLMAEMQALDAELSSVADATDEASQEEMEMNDDGQRTPEHRVEALHAEIERRLAAAIQDRESKGLDQGQCGTVGASRDGGPAAGSSAAPDSSA
jgi:primosomal protein N''